MAALLPRAVVVDAAPGPCVAEMCVTSLGRVDAWHPEEGWGVITAAETPGGCWAHFSAVVGTGYAELVPGDAVSFTFERAEQDGYRFRAVAVWPAGVNPVTAAAPAPPEAGAAYRSGLSIRFDDGTEVTGADAAELVRRAAASRHEPQARPSSSSE